jgi:hypothetical protein
MARQLVSLREASRQLGFKLSSLQHHIKRGNVTPIDGKIDVEVARIQLAKYVDPLQSRRARARLGMPEPVVPATPPEASPDEHANWMERRTRAEALRAELELKVRAGELVEVAAYDQKLSRFLGDLSTRMDTLADRIAAEFGGDAALRRRIAEEIDRIRHEAIDAAIDGHRAAA